ncbi:MAG: RNA-binding protein [Candidatus Competibacteraceae bacterium]
MTSFLSRLHACHWVSNRNFVKPGVAEATRVLLRRLPGLLLLVRCRSSRCRAFAIAGQEKRVPVVIDPAMPIQATALIEDLS